jgi:hypothetical protein
MTVGIYILFSSFLIPKELKQKRFTQKISEMLVEKEGLTPLTEGQNLISIVALCVDKEGNDIETPQFVLKIK